MLSLECLYKLKSKLDSDAEGFRSVYKKLTPEIQAYIANHWYFGTARLNQIVDWHSDWYMKVYKPGRGFGKNWMLSRNSLDAAIENPGIHINCFAKTQGECNDTLILGDSGIANAAEERGLELISGTKRDKPPTGKIIYLFSKDHIQLRFWNGSIIRFYSANKTRGKQSHMTFVDEIFTWFETETGRDQKLTIALEEIETITRLGANPRVILTSTPQAVSILKELYERRDKGENIDIISGTTFDNPHLSEEYKQRMLDKFGSTRRGLQELYGSEQWEVPGALWTQEMIQYVEEIPDEIERTVVAIDPAATSNTKSDETGIIVCARGKKRSDGRNRYYVLDDRSGRFSPRDWATKAINLYHQYDAQQIVYETNMGGEMVAETIRNIQRNMPLKGVRAAKGKYARAEPVAALYEQNLVYHVKGLKVLEDQLTSYNPEFFKGSPDRLDALVWGLHELSNKGEYKISWV